MDIAGKSFQFNLLPPKPKEVVELEAERDDSVLYAFVLIFVSALIFFALVLVQSFLVEPRVASTQSALTTRQAQIAAYASVQALHGELFIKTQTLKPLLDKNINPDEIFRVADALVAGKQGFQIENYAREQSGLFVFQILCPTFEDVATLESQAEAISGVSDVFVRGASLIETSNLVRTIIALNIDALGQSTP